MFFFDDDGAQAVLFGQDKGIVIGHTVIPATGEVQYACLILGNMADGNIVNIEGKTKKDFNPKIRMLFENIDDVDLIIDYLKEVKKSLGNADIDNILKPGKN